MTWQVHPENCARCALRQQRHATGMHALDVILHPACAGGSAVSTLHATGCRSGRERGARASCAHERTQGRAHNTPEAILERHDNFIVAHFFDPNAAGARILDLRMQLSSVLITPGPCTRAHAATWRPRARGTWLLNASVWAGWCSALGSFFCRDEISLLRRFAGLEAILNRRNWHTNQHKVHEHGTQCPPRSRRGRGDWGYSEWP